MTPMVQNIFEMTLKSAYNAEDVKNQLKEKVRLFQIYRFINLWSKFLIISFQKQIQKYSKGSNKQWIIQIISIKKMKKIKMF